MDGYISRMGALGAGPVSCKGIELCEPSKESSAHTGVNVLRAVDDHFDGDERELEIVSPTERAREPNRRTPPLVHMRLALRRVAPHALAECASDAHVEISEE